MSLFKNLYLIFLLAALTGCATSRSIVSPSTAQINNPQSGKTIKIVSVVDTRKFEIAPSDPSTPSLMDSEINDAKIKSRAVGRKRNTYGKALGDILLPENTSVTALTEEAIKNGFKKAGYKVLEKDDPGYNSAQKVNADIAEFWSWFQPGFWALTLSFKSKVEFDSELPELKKNNVISAKSSESMQMATDDDWQKIISKGLSELSAAIENKLTQK